jgi:hypothetical protein
LKLPNQQFCQFQWRNSSNLIIARCHLWLSFTTAHNKIYSRQWRIKSRFFLSGKVERAMARQTKSQTQIIIYVIELVAFLDISCLLRDICVLVMFPILVFSDSSIYSTWWKINALIVKPRREFTGIEMKCWKDKGEFLFSGLSKSCLLLGISCDTVKSLSATSPRFQMFMSFSCFVALKCVSLSFDFPSK